MSELKKLLKKSERLFLTLAVMAIMTLPALASGETQTETDGVFVVTDAIVSALTAAVPKILLGVGAVAAVGVGIFAARFAVRAGLSMFRQVTGR